MKNTVVLLLALVTVFTHRALGADFEPVESSPTTISGLEFSIVSQKQWRFPSKGRFEAIVVLQLRIKNDGDKPVVFTTFETFGLILKRVDGKEIRRRFARDASMITPNIQLMPGAAYSYPLVATLRAVPRGSGTELLFEDGTGSRFFASMLPGEYTVGFSLRPDVNILEEGEGTPQWAGTGKTTLIKVTVLSGSEKPNSANKAQK